MAVQDLQRIEDKIDRAAAGAIAVSDHIGGIMFENMSEVLEFAKLMSVAKNAVPPHLRGEPGTCLAVTIQALEWRMSPFAVANKSYEVNGRVAYEAQLIHAVVEARAPLKQRLRKSYKGEGLALQCVVTGHFKGEDQPIEYESPKLSEIKVQNSPLWKTDPRQQLWYYSVRAWARANCPDVLLGIYSEDELRESDPLPGSDHARDITPGPDIKGRLGGKKDKRGFSEAGIAEALKGDAPPAAEKPSAEILPPEGGAAQLDLAEDVENELANKRRAVENADALEDLKHIAAGVTDYLKRNKRTDLLSGFLSAVAEREKKLTALPAKTPTDNF